jgi:DNA-directed RNA polymerase subunit RPC12/RpoP
MSVAGLCGVCERAEAKYVCDRCGTPVCEDHHDHELGLCSKCAAQVRASRGEGSDADADDTAGGGTWNQ